MRSCALQLGQILELQALQRMLMLAHSACIGGRSASAAPLHGSQVYSWGLNCSAAGMRA